MSEKYPEAPSWSANEVADLADEHELIVHGLNQEIAALRRQIAAMQEYMNHHYCPFLVNGQHLTHLGNFVHLNPEYNDEN